MEGTAMVSHMWTCLPMSTAVSWWLHFADIDECTENTDGCQHTCINTDGSFQCSCRDGFRLGNDGRSCVGKFATSCMDSTLVIELLLLRPAQIIYTAFLS